MALQTTLYFKISMSGIRNRLEEPEAAVDTSRDLSRIKPDERFSAKTFTQRLSKQALISLLDCSHMVGTSVSTFIIINRCAVCQIVLSSNYASTS